jgi:hypothetical protein
MYMGTTIEPIPMPIPTTSLPHIKTHKDGARPRRIEPAQKVTDATIMAGLRPKRRLSGTATAAPTIAVRIVEDTTTSCSNEVS